MGKPETPNTNSLNKNIQERNRSRSDFQCSNSFKNKDYITKTVLSNLIGSIKKNATNLSEIKSHSILVKTAELNKFLNSVILLLLILILILNIHGKISEQKFIDTVDRGSVNEKASVTSAEQKRSPGKRVKNKVSTEFDQRCKKYRRDLEELQYGVFMNRKHVDKLVQELVDNYDSMKNYIPKISTEEIRYLGKFAKVLTICNEPQADKIVQKISHVSFQYYILISILKDWKMAKTTSDVAKYRKEFYTFLRNVRLEDFNVGLTIDKMSIDFLKSLENKNIQEREREYFKEKSYALRVSQIASTYSSLLEDLKKLKSL